jgi:hypothetical protein
VYARIWGDVPGRRPAYLWRRIGAGWLACTVVAFAVLHWTGLAPRREPSEAGAFLLRHSSPGDRIFVWGQAPSLYLEARGRPASRYIATFPLTGYIFGAPLPGVDTRDRIVPGSWRTLQRDLTARPPAFIVDTEVREGSRYPLAAFPFLARLVDDEYRAVATLRTAVIYRRCATAKARGPRCGDDAEARREAADPLAAVPNMY